MVKGITSYLSFINIKDSMSPEQIEETAQLIYEDFHADTSADFKLFINMCKKRAFGSDYNRIDGSIIYSWYRMFHQQLMDKIDEQKYQEHLNKKEELGNEPLIPGFVLFTQLPEDDQRRINKTFRGVYATDSEIEEMKKVENARKQFILDYIKHKGPLDTEEKITNMETLLKQHGL